MKILAVSVLALLCPFAAIQQSAAAPADLDVGVSNSPQIPEIPGFTLRYTAPSTTNPTGSSLWWARDTTHEWTFMHTGSTTDRWVMKLAADHSLKLYVNSPNNAIAAITLNPSGTSAFQNSVTIGAGGYNSAIMLNSAGPSSFQNSLVLSGSSNLMPNQILNQGSSTPAVILNVGLADGRYIKQGAQSFGSGNTFANNGMVFGTTSSATGVDSFAFGTNSTATNLNSFAAGSYAWATGPYSVAMGGGSNASGWISTALGNSTASGAHSTALSQGQALGWDSLATGGSTSKGAYGTALGFSTTGLAYYATAGGLAQALGYASTAFGQGSATGDTSTAFGSSVASGFVAFAAGFQGLASGDFATSLGYQSSANSYQEVVIGRWNALGTNSLTEWRSQDDLFVVGNGTGPQVENHSNAFAVKKNGDTTIAGKLDVNGVVHVARGGDIPMFAY